MNRRRLVTSATLVIGFLVPAMASAETLEEALASAYNTNSGLQAQRAALRATDELVPQALSNWRPTIRLQGDIGQWQTYSTQLSGVDQQDQPLYARDDSATITEPLYRGGRTVAQTEQAEAQVRAGRATLQSTEQTVLLNAVTAYAAVVQDMATVGVQQKNEQLLEGQLNAVNQKYQVGQAAQTDVAQAQAAVSGAKAAIIQAQGQLQNDSANYADIIGHPPANLSAPDPSTGLPASLDATTAQALATNPSVVAQQYTYQAAQHAVDVQFGSLLPQLSLNGTYSRTLQETNRSSYINNEQTTLELQIPIYQSGSEYSILRQLKQTAAQQQLQLDQVQHDTLNSATAAWDSLQTAAAQVQSLQSQVSAAQVALNGVQQQYQVGTETILDVLTSAQNLLTAQVNLVGAQRNQVVASYEVRSATGALTASALKLPVNEYDPTVHYNDVRNRVIGGSIDPNAGSGLLGKYGVGY